MSEAFIGEIRVFAFPFAPNGWMTCAGQLLPIRQYTALFAILGVTYGGDGRTTFGLPNLSGTVPVSAGQGAGLEHGWQLGETAGTATVALDQTQMPAHAHSFAASSTPATTASPVGAVPARGNYSGQGGSGAVPLYVTGTAGTAMAAQSLGRTGGNAAHNNMMPGLVMNYCIALVGDFPPRS